MDRRRSAAALGTLVALTVALLGAPGGAVPSAAATTPAATTPAAASMTVSSAAAPVGTPAGHDYATDRFSDPWDYSNLSDLLVDGGPTAGAAPIGISGGTVSAHFVSAGYVSPIWGGYGGPLLLGRDGAAPGNALNSAAYQMVSFQAWSNRDVPAGLLWFNCPGGAVNQSCGGGLSFTLRAGWNTYVMSPHASVFAGWPLAYGGSINGLRLAVSPGAAGSDVKLDWFRSSSPAPARRSRSPTRRRARPHSSGTATRATPTTTPARSPTVSSHRSRPVAAAGSTSRSCRRAPTASAPRAARASPAGRPSRRRPPSRGC